MARKITHPRRGEVWLLNFDPTIGAEIKKTRPALIIQNDTQKPSFRMTLPDQRAR
jgi:mRNA interferase MazF